MHPIHGAITNRRGVAGALAACLLLTAVNIKADSLVVYQQDEITRPEDVVSFLRPSVTPAPAIKMRGIRVLSTVGNVASSSARVSSEKRPGLPDCPDAHGVARHQANYHDPQPAKFKVRGIRLPPTQLAQADQAPAPRSTPESSQVDCPPNASAPGPDQFAGRGAPDGEHHPEDVNPSSIALLIQFRFNSTQIMPEATPQLDALAEGIKLAGPNVKLIIEGHTDARGSDQYNLILSYLRASAVKDYLVQAHKLSAENLKVIGMGKRAPLNTHDPSAPENRRVEFRIEQS